MYFKRIVLSVVGIAIALALTAQSVYDISYSTYNCPDNLPYGTLLDKYCPNLQLWNNHDKNFPCHVSVIKLNGHYSDCKEAKEYYPMSDKELKFIQSIRKSDLAFTNPFLVTLYRNFNGKRINVNIPTTNWNITHKKPERVKDFIIKDFQLKRLVAVVYFDNRLFFFIKKDETSMTCYYYKSIGTFVYSNYGEVTAIDDNDSINYFLIWLASIPLPSLPKEEGQKLLSLIVSKADGKNQFTIDLPFVFKDNTPRSIL